MLQKIMKLLAHESNTLFDVATHRHQLIQACIDLIPLMNIHGKSILILEPETQQFFLTKNASLILRHTLQKNCLVELVLNWLSNMQITMGEGIKWNAVLMALLLKEIQQKTAEEPFVWNFRKWSQLMQDFVLFLKTHQHQITIPYNNNALQSMIRYQFECKSCFSKSFLEQLFAMLGSSAVEKQIKVISSNEHFSSKFIFTNSYFIPYHVQNVASFSKPTNLNVLFVYSTQYLYFKNVQTTDTDRLIRQEQLFYKKIIADCNKQKIHCIIVKSSLQYPFQSSIGKHLFANAQLPIIEVDSVSAWNDLVCVHENQNTKMVPLTLYQQGDMLCLIHEQLLRHFVIVVAENQVIEQELQTILQFLHHYKLLDEKQHENGRFCTSYFLDHLLLCLDTDALASQTFAPVYNAISKLKQALQTKPQEEEVLDLWQHKLDQFYSVFQWLQQLLKIDQVFSLKV